MGTKPDPAPSVCFSSCCTGWAGPGLGTWQLVPRPGAGEEVTRLFAVMDRGWVAPGEGVPAAACNASRASSGTGNLLLPTITYFTSRRPDED